MTLFEIILFFATLIAGFAITITAAIGVLFWLSANPGWLRHLERGRQTRPSRLREPTTGTGLLG